MSKPDHAPLPSLVPHSRPQRKGNPPGAHRGVRANLRAACLGLSGARSGSGAKFYDADADGVWEEGEPGIEGWKVHLTGGTVDLYALTDSDGEFSFTGLAPGDYTVSEVFPLSPPIWLPTTATSFDATVTAGQNFVGPDFGNVCLGCNGGGHTLGFWSNNNGAAKHRIQ